MSASAPIADPGRLAALRALHILDTPPEEKFDRLTRLAARLLGSPIVLVSLVDDNRQFFKSATGLSGPLLEERGTPLSHSFCKHVIETSAPLIIEDATVHPLVQNSPSIPEYGIRAYAGVPLNVDGNDIGAFCAVDTNTRKWSEADVEILRDLARSVVSEIELRRTLKEMHEQQAMLRAMYDGSAVAVGIADLRGHLIGHNPAYRQLMGYSDAELAGMHVADLSPEEDRPGERLVLKMPPATVAGFHREKRFLRKDGRIFIGRVSTSYIRDETGRPRYVTAMVIDVTEERRVANALALSEATHRAIIDNLPDGAVLLVDQNLRFLAAAGPVLPKILEIANVPDLVGRTVPEVASGPNREQTIQIYADAVAGRARRLEIVRRGRTFEMRAVPLTAGGAGHAMVFLYDITERKAETEALRVAHRDLGAERTMFATTLEHIEDGVALLDGSRRILLANEACAELLGMAGPLVGRRLDDTPCFVGDEALVTEPRRRILRRRMSPVPWAGGDGFVVVWRDVTAERDLERERERELLTDSLMGIPNRRAAERALEVEVSRMRRTQSRLCVALLDVDHFKRVNDEHGHAVGDEVLRGIARVVSAAARKTDVVARWGGEELLAILPAGLEGALVFCERARAAVAAAAHGRAGRVTISAGAAEVAEGESVSDALGRADAKLYEAKRGGRNCVMS